MDGERTLALDIGGSRLKACLLDSKGRIEEGPRSRATPRPSNPEVLLDTVADLARECGTYTRIGAGFPGVVEEGRTRGAVNLAEGWTDYDLAGALERMLGAPARVANDADVAGLGAVEGRGKELVLTLGTGVGSSFFLDGRLIPNLEFGHLPMDGEGSFEERLGDPALREAGEEVWRARLREALEILLPCLSPRLCHLGGGNARLLEEGDLPPNCRRVSNDCGLLGAHHLWTPRA